MTGETDALARALGHELGLGAGGIGQIHAAIAARVFSRLGAAAEPARRTHDAIAGGAYAAVSGSAVLAGRAAGAALPPRELSTTRRGAMALAVLGGLHGDRLEAEGSPLYEPPALRATSPPIECPMSAIDSTGTGHAATASSSSAARSQPLREMWRPVL